MVPLTYWQIGFGYILYYASPFVSEACLMALYMFQIRYYTVIGEKETTRRVLKVLDKECRAVSSKHVNGKEVPSGYFFGPQCIGYIDNKRGYDSEDSIHLITTAAFYKQLMEQQIVTMKPLQQVDKAATKEPVERQTIQVFTRVGSYTSFFYRSIQLDVSHIQPIGGQIPIVKDIVELYRTKGRATIFLHGVSCAGKSSVGYLVAKEVKGSFCHTFHPTDPGDNFSSMVQDIRQKGDDAPLVIVLEEVDGILRAIHENTILLNPKTPTSVRDKGSWSTLLDDMIFYKNVIFILTSNESKEALDALDPAYLRKGRIDASYAMLEELPLDNL